MNLIIREADYNDYSEIYSLNIEVYKLHYKNRPDVYLDIENPFPRQHFYDMLKSINTKIFIVEEVDKKELAAYALLQIIFTNNPICVLKKLIYIDDFCVKSDLKRTGIGSLLFNHIVDFAKSENASAIHLTVWEFNKDAIKFYEAMGMDTRNRRMEINIQN